MRHFLRLMTVLVMLWGCSSSDNGATMSDDVDPGPPSQSFERRPMLINWADNIIIPGYEAFTGELDKLQIAFDDFKQDSNEANLLAFRTAWLDAYLMWQRIDMFEIGPAENVGLRLNANIYPVDFEKVEQHVASGDYDLTLPSNRDTKGFPALDYLINGLGDSDADIVSKYNELASKDNYIAYVEAVLADMQQLSNTVLSDWKEGYRDTFVNNDGSSSTASVDRFVNDYIFYYEKFLRAGKMGIPLGVFSGTPLPENVEAYHKGDVSKQLFLEGLDAVQDFFNGRHFSSSTTGEGLASYLDALNALKEGEDLNNIINDQFDTARESVNGLGAFRTEIEDNTPPTTMLQAYDEVQRAVPLLKVDMVSAMSISIDFVDADGD